MRAIPQLVSAPFFDCRLKGNNSFYLSFINFCNTILGLVYIPHGQKQIVGFET